MFERALGAGVAGVLHFLYKGETVSRRDMTTAAPLRSGLAGTLRDLKNPTFTSFLDLVRWTCAWIVFLGHLRNPLFLGYESLASADRGLLVMTWYFVTGWAGEAVVVFFVLSGYLVGGVSCAKASAGRFAVVDYAIDRASRIFAPFLPALLLTVVLDAGGGAFFNDLGYYDHIHPMIREKNPGEPFASYLTARNFALNLLMLQTIIAPPFGSNLPLWTISLEFWFYVVFGLGLGSWLSGPAARRWAGLAGMALLAALLGGSFIIHMGVWLIGVGVAFVSIRTLERPLLAVCTFFGVLVLLRFTKGASAHIDLIIALNYIVACSFAWLLLSMRQVRLGLLERWRSLNAFMASFSYSLYLIHFPLMLFILGLLHATGWFNGIDQGYSPVDARGLLAYATVAGVVGFCAFVFAQFTERQTPRLRLILKRRFG